MVANNHFDHIDREESLRRDRKADRYSLGKRSSVSSYRYSRSHSSRKKQKGGGDSENCISNLKMVLQCYNVFILVSSKTGYHIIITYMTHLYHI